MLGWARPARIAANSSRVASTDLAIFWSASLRTSLITCLLLGGCSYVDESCGPVRAGSAVAAHQRANLLTLHGPGDRAGGGQVEEHHRHVVVARQADGGGVGDLEVAGEVLVVAEVVELDGVGVVLGVGVVDPVDTLLAHQDDLAPGLERPLRSDRVGGEERHART